MWGNGGIGGIGGPTASGGTGGRALLFGAGGAGGEGGVISGTGGVAGGPATVQLKMFGTKPQFAVSVDGGQPVYATVDSGSTPVLLPPRAVNLAALGAPTETGLTASFGTKGNSGTDTYNTYTGELDLGNGIETQSTTIGVITGSTRTVDGVTYDLPPDRWRALIGVGVNTSSTEFPTNALQALPGTLGEGVLINQPGHYFQFGPNPLTPIASVSGAPIGSDLLISIDGEPYVQVAHGGIDSGGAMGFVPSSLVPTTVNGRVPVGTTITVATGAVADPTVLYEQQITPTTTLPYTPFTVPDTANYDFNSGNYPYSQMPIYTSFSPSGVGTTIFDQKPT